MTAIRLHPHDGGLLAPHDLWTAWSREPAVIVGLGVAAVLYAVGMARLRRRTRTHASARIMEATAFWSGWAVLAVALVSPLHRLGETLLWAHMAQHELLMVVAAPLLVLGRPFVVSLWGMPGGWRRAVGAVTARLRPLWRLVSRLEVAWLLHALAIVGWHVPALYQRTVSSELVHALQHTSFLLTALLFWWSVLRAATQRGRHGAALMSLFSTMVYTGGLGALLTLARTPWYPAYGDGAPLWGLTALEDQQLAGLIMWVPGGITYLLATLWLVVAWLQASEAKVVRLERSRASAASVLLVALLLAGCDRGHAISTADAAQLTGGNPARGRVAFRQYGCGACHTVGGLPGAHGTVGPPLGGIGGRAYIAGVLTNSPENLARWIRSPREVDPRTAMPDVGVSAASARDIAAFLYTRP
jgi:putative membrane protein